MTGCCSDGEHAPNDVPLLVSQLQAMTGSASHPVVRPPVGETWIVKQLLDIGAQTLLIPMIESREQAEAMVKPCAIRRMGCVVSVPLWRGLLPSTVSLIIYRRPMTRFVFCCRWKAARGLPILMQLPRPKAWTASSSAPADLAADMGHLGKPGAQEVQDAVRDALQRIIGHGKAAGILTGDLSLARHYP